MSPTNSQNSAPEPLIQLCDVSMRREYRTVLSEINLSVAPGDFLAITGPNGGGKTTLMRIILGLLKPTTGRVVYRHDGQIVSKLPIGYLPQKNQIDSHFPITVEEVVASGLLGQKGLSAEQRAERVEHTLEQIGMADLRQRPIGRLSGGQVQRTLLGRALVGRWSVLILDEPLSYIDKNFESHLYDIIEQEATHSTILLVSHEMTRIAAMANRHLIVDRTITDCHAHHHYFSSPCDC